MAFAAYYARRITPSCPLATALTLSGAASAEPEIVAAA